MPDIILDTMVLGDFLAQYFDSAGVNRGLGVGRFMHGGTITKNLSRKLNTFLCDGQEPLGSLVIASAFAFVELARKWDLFVGGRFSMDQLHAFVDQPPDWFDIAPVDEDLLPFYVNVPGLVYLGGQHVPIEWTDAVHVATTLSRGHTALLATTDRKIKAMNLFIHRVVS